MTSVICVIVFDELFSNQHLLLVSFISLCEEFTLAIICDVCGLIDLIKCW